MKHIEFISGPIQEELIQHHLQAVSSNVEVGGIDIFIGNVRADELGASRVSSIEFTHEPIMANNQLSSIIDEVAEQYHCKVTVVLHSLQKVDVGHMCMAVITGCKHRGDAYDSNRAIVERLKKEVPIWGKEIAEGNASQWKVNTE